MAEKITKLGENYIDKDEIPTESPQKNKVRSKFKNLMFTLQRNYLLINQISQDISGKSHL